MELIAESVMKITSVIPIPGGSTLVSEGNVGKYGKVLRATTFTQIVRLKMQEILMAKLEH